MDNNDHDGSRRFVSGPRGLLRIDGPAILVGSIAAYALVDGPCTTPGTRCSFHWDSSQWAVLGSMTVVVEIGIIWAAHLGMDHLFGYGFKYASRFKDTHFERV